MTSMRFKVCQGVDFVMDVHAPPGLVLMLDPRMRMELHVYGNAVERWVLLGSPETCGHLMGINLAAAHHPHREGGP